MVVLISLVVSCVFAVSSENNHIYKTYRRLVTTQIQNQERKFSRNKLYLESVELLKSHAFLGIGYSSLKSYLAEKYNFRGRTSHNVVLEVWLTSGIIGLSIFAIIIYKVFKNLIACSSYYKRSDKYISDFYLTVLFSFLILLLHAQFRGLFGNLMFYIPLSIGLSASCQKHKISCAKKHGE